MTDSSNGTVKAKRMSSLRSVHGRGNENDWLEVVVANDGTMCPARKEKIISNDIMECGH